MQIAVDFDESRTAAHYPQFQNRRRSSPPPPPPPAAAVPEAVRSPAA